MAATELGTTGKWGIPEDEDGILISDINFDFSQKDKPVLDKGGEVIGMSIYQQKCDIKFTGLVDKNSAFSDKLGAALAMSNTVPDHMSTSGGTTVLMGLSRKCVQEDFESIDVSATNFPLLVTAVPGP